MNEENQKMEKEKKRLIVTTVLICAGVGMIYAASLLAGDAFYEFCSNTVCRVYMGIAAAFAAVWMNLKDKG